MSRYWSSFKIIALLAVGAVVKTRVKSVIVGCLMIFGAALTITGTALLDSIERSMTQSITSSLAGHLQVYSKDAKDELALFGSGFIGSDDYGTIQNFKSVRDELIKMENVKAVVPMGTLIGMANTGNDFDKNIELLRKSVREGRKDDAAKQIETIKQMAKLLKEEMQNGMIVVKDKEKLQGNIKKVEKVLSSEFWEKFETDPETQLLFLDSQIAQLQEDSEMLFLRIMGTDLDMFKREFPRMKIVEGEMVPKGKPGFLGSKYMTEKWLKHRTARHFDEIREAVEKKGKKIADDPDLTSKIKIMKKQASKITFQLSPENAQKLEAEIKKLTPQAQGDLTDLIKEFLSLNDENFSARYKFFYDMIAPMITLYPLKVGDTITVRSYAKSGYLKSVNLKLYGLFTFEGLEETEIANVYNFIDLISFRELYGQMSEENLKELEKIRGSVGVKDVDRDEAEADLFGSGASPIAAKDAAAAKFDEFAEARLGGKAGKLRSANETSFAQEEVDNGLALNAAIILNDPSKLSQTKAAIIKAADAKGLNLKVIDWQEAAGMVGQFVTVVRIVLYVSIFIIFLVALVIINNSMIIATMERVGEIGTMRAVGARPRFILTLFLIETLILGAVSCAVGTLLAVILMNYLGSVGIPSNSDALTFLFSGPRLFPTLGTGNIITGFVTIIVVTILSTLYPAYLATRISPANAMRRSE